MSGGESTMLYQIAVKSALMAGAPQIVITALPLPSASTPSMSSPRKEAPVQGLACDEHTPAEHVPVSAEHGVLSGSGATFGTRADMS
jgi:hypothetical protein